jgi:glycine betaine/choline ABC-type transport system substrate-binding protein
MRRLNARIDRDKERPEKVAAEFLASAAAGARR